MREKNYYFIRLVENLDLRIKLLENIDPLLWIIKFSGKSIGKIRISKVWPKVFGHKVDVFLIFGSFPVPPNDKSFKIFVFYEF
jgi:hypothetical protein